MWGLKEMAAILTHSPEGQEVAVEKAFCVLSWIRLIHFLGNAARRTHLICSSIHRKILRSEMNWSIKLSRSFNIRCATRNSLLTTPTNWLWSDNVWFLSEENNRLLFCWPVAELSCQWNNQQVHGNWSGRTLQVLDNTLGCYLCLRLTTWKMAD